MNEGVMQFLSSFINTAADNVRATLEFKAMSLEKMQQVCDVFVARNKELDFQKVMSFLYVCLGMCVHHPLHDSVTRAHLKRMIGSVKTHPHLKSAELLRFESCCISRKILPRKTYEDMVADDLEPLEKRVHAMMQAVSQGPPRTLTIKDFQAMLEITVKQINQ